MEEGNLEPKSDQLPIVLFLIDYSSSMEGMICETGMIQHMSKELLELMEGSELVRKSRQYSRESLTRMLTKINETAQLRVPANNSFVSKKQLMLAVLSKVLRLIKMKVDSEP